MFSAHSAKARTNKHSSLLQTNRHTMNARLSMSQQRAICSQMGSVTLELLYKASVHGFTAADFHARCDNRCPTVSVGYNASGYVFGGYTQRPFSQSGRYERDDQAYLFTLKGENLIKHPVNYPDYAVKMMSNRGPYFGEALVLMNGNNTVFSNPGEYYTFSATKMHGNDLILTDCEVYEVKEAAEDVYFDQECDVLERPWRTIVWEAEKRQELMDRIQSYKPRIDSVSRSRVLLIGPVGAGKSSFFNSVSSVFRGHVTNQAIAGCSGSSVTTQFRTYSLKHGREGKLLPIVLCDTMGLEERTGAGPDIDDIISAVRGHLPDGYQFNPAAPLQAGASAFQTPKGPADTIHCVAYVIDACSVSIVASKLMEKLEAIHRKINSLGVPQMVLLTKVDDACPLVKDDVRNVYKSRYIKDMMQTVSQRLGIPLSLIVPVKNYSEELELDLSCDILLLSAVIQMLRYTDDYFDDITERFRNMKIKSEQ